MGDTYSSDYIIFQKDGKEYLVVQFDIPDDLKVYQSNYDETIVTQCWLNYYRTNPTIRLPDFTDSLLGYVSKVNCHGENLLINYIVSKPKELITQLQRKGVRLIATAVVKN
jgi:hypothetical protein